MYHKPCLPNPISHPYRRSPDPYPYPKADRPALPIKNHMSCPFPVPAAPQAKVLFRQPAAASPGRDRDRSSAATADGGIIPKKLKAAAVDHHPPGRGEKEPGVVVESMWKSSSPAMRIMS